MIEVEVYTLSCTEVASGKFPLFSPSFPILWGLSENKCYPFQTIEARPVTN